MTDSSTWNVIVTDDELDSVRVVEHVCTFHGARVRTANSGEHCLKLFDQEVPDILLVDIQMPDMPGWEVLKLIRANQVWDQVIVIAVTAHAMYGDRERIMAAGFDGYFPKPISALHLINDMSAIIDQKRTV